LTVFSARCISSPIWRLVRPAATSDRIRSSCGDRRASFSSLRVRLPLRPSPRWRPVAWATAAWAAAMGALAVVLPDAEVNGTPLASNPLPLPADAEQFLQRTGGLWWDLLLVV